jgi:hypothetical protein
MNDNMLTSIETWTSRALRHTALVAPFADAYVKRRDLGLKHPVHDFLFTYYTCSPLKLKQWVPSFEETLIISEEALEAHSWLKNDWFGLDQKRLSLNFKRISESTIGLATFIAQLCENIIERTPRFGCYGLHEWAMVYQLSPETIRHHGHRLRLSFQEIAHFVENQTLCCSHYDAYRFFTPEAKPLNTLNPTLDSRLQMEQGGCLHANMDLYKWATKLWPWIGSEFISEAFFLALEGRELDMRASPYDLTEEGYSPICIETEEGRKQYQQAQQLYAERANLLRQKLHAFCEKFIRLNKNLIPKEAIYI